jgi:hypothetical protein
MILPIQLYRRYGKGGVEVSVRNIIAGLMKLYREEMVYLLKYYAINGIITT